MKTSINISPIFYMGNKKKVIKKGLIDLFPDNIKNFYELFAGSGIVSMNTSAENYIINDTDNFLYNIYKILKSQKAEFIISRINENINKFNLARERTKRNEFKDSEKIEEYKKSYYDFREYCNKTKDPLDLYTLTFYSFSQQFRLNNKGEFNMPCGNDCFSITNEDYIKKGCEFFSSPNVDICHKDFKAFNGIKFEQGDFIYLDPPYLGTVATYNENKGWNEQMENELYTFCENINKQGCKFGLSNLLYNKGEYNDKIMNWCEKNKWSVHTFNDFDYYACGKGKVHSEEIYISNY